MKNIILTLLFLFAIETYSQVKKKRFCSEIKNDDYFLMDIKMKKIIWKNTFYLENKIKQLEIKGTSYTEYSQEWESGDTAIMYLRKKGDIVLQYDKCCEEETIRYNEKFMVGHIWFAQDSSKYTVESKKGRLKTPKCNYNNLLVIKGEFLNGNFNFYYKKGYGYVGATQDGNLISYVVNDSRTNN